MCKPSEGYLCGFRGYRHTGCKSDSGGLDACRIKSRLVCGRKGQPCWLPERALIKDFIGLLVVCACVHTLLARAPGIAAMELSELLLFL